MVAKSTSQPISVSEVRIIGSVNEDTCLSLRAHVRPGETVTAAGITRNLGGKGLNQAIAARRAGVPTTLVAALGDDDAGHTVRRFLTAEGVETRLHRAQGSTGSAIVAVDSAGENAIIVVPGANGEIPEDFAARHAGDISPGDVVVLQLELPLSVVWAAATAARASGARVILNAAPATQGVETLLPAVDLLVVNSSELAALELGEPADAARRVHQRFGTAVLVTLGGQGSLLANNHGVLTVPASPTDAVDTTGAGDTYVGYLAAALAAGSRWPEAMEHASVAASIAVSRHGASAAVPYHHELEEIR
ncbi:ribokinase [Rhodococcus koreensis]|uniref:ribokinase n=1 Tax=Rhodococcus koreensis TaxID=99653 RepID=UPI00366A616E